MTAMEHLTQRSKAFSWDELRYFLAVCDLGSFRKSAEALGVSVNRVRRSVESLEAELSVLLFVRSPNGVEMTPDARAVYSVGIEIQERVGFLHNFAIRKSSNAEGLVRLTITEGLGTFWVTPKLTDFTQRHPRIRLDLRCEMRVPDLSRLESDIAIQLEKPRDEELVCKKIAYLHLLFFASRDYIATYGVPRNFADLADLNFIHLVADQIPSHIVNERAAFDPQLKFARILVNTSSAQAMAIAEGAGVGILPSYGAALSKRLIPIESEFLLSRPVWLVYHPDVIRLKRVRMVVDWLTEIFNPKIYPWFRDEFIPPDNFKKQIAESAMFHHSIEWEALSSSIDRK